MGKTFDATQDQKVKELDERIENARARLEELNNEQVAEQAEVQSLQEKLMQLMFEKKPEKDTISQLTSAQERINGRAGVIKMVKAMHGKAVMERSIIVNANSLAEAREIKAEAWKKTTEALAKLGGLVGEFESAYQLTLKYGEFIPGTHKCWQQQAMIALTNNYKAEITALLNSYRNLPACDDIYPLNNG